MSVASGHRSLGECDQPEQRSATMADTKDRSRDDDQVQARLPNLMRIDEVAEHLGVSVRHVRRLVQERRIPFLKWGHFVMFDDAEIAVWLEQFRIPAESDQRWR
jgi:excisionase family DNA binding protein